MESPTLISPQREPFSLHSASLSSDLTPLQSQVDGLVGSFAQQATDWRSLVALMVGGLAYRFGRIGAMGAGASHLGSSLSIGVGLGAEVTAFEMANRSLMDLTGERKSNGNLWRWEGQGGIRQGLLSSLVTFGTLKGAGHLAQGENVVVQHLLQDTGMVLGHQVSGAFGITPRPTGSLAEQFLHAEATNLQLSAGMALAHSAAPGIQALERGLDLSLRLTDVGMRSPHLQNGLRPAFAVSNGPGDHGLAMSAVKDETPSKLPQVGTHQTGQRVATHHPAIALFLKVAEKEGKSLEDLEGIVSQEELISLAQLPGSPMMPKRGDTQTAIINQIFTSEANLREKFETLKRTLEDPYYLGCVFAGASANVATVPFTYMELNRMDWPEETLESLMRSDRTDLPQGLEDSRQEISKALPILGELYRILGSAENGLFLRGAVIGLDRPGRRGIRFHYRDFESKVLSGLSQDSLSRLGLQSIPDYRELMLRAWRLTRTRSGS